jgi:hypothetical protein
MSRSNRQRRSSVTRPDEIERRLRAKLGPEAEGKLVAMHPKTGEFIVAEDMDRLVLAISRSRLGESAELRIFRIGPRAALELRRQ